MQKQSFNRKMNLICSYHWWCSYYNALFWNMHCEAQCMNKISKYSTTSFLFWKIKESSFTFVVFFLLGFFHSIYLMLRIDFFCNLSLKNNTLMIMTILTFSFLHEYGKIKATLNKILSNIQHHNILSAIKNTCKISALEWRTTTIDCAHLMGN